MNRYFTMPPMSPMPTDLPPPAAVMSGLPVPSWKEETPSTSTVTSGTATPRSRLSVTPSAPEITTVLDDSAKVAVVVRALAGVVALTAPSGSCSSVRSSSRLKLLYVKLTPTLTLPSPAVNARSANDGPKVVAVRTWSPVVGSSLNTNPPDEVLNGVVPTSRPSPSAMASPAGTPAVWVNTEIVWRRLRPSVVVTFSGGTAGCAATGVLHASAIRMNGTASGRVIVIGRLSRESDTLFPSQTFGFKPVFIALFARQVK